jgi:hypothetical protein
MVMRWANRKWICPVCAREHEVTIHLVDSGPEYVQEVLF